MPIYTHIRYAILKRGGNTVLLHGLNRSNTDHVIIAALTDDAGSEDDAV